MKRTLVLAITLLLFGSYFNSASAQNLRSGLIPALAPFYHGVASGDPLTDRVILWTRITPDSTVTPGDSVMVQWRIATDTSMSNVINSGFGYAGDNSDFTFKVDASGLSPDQCYFYDFFALGKYSVRGRTFTAPQGDVDSLRFAVVSCSSYEHGYFNVYRRLLQRNDFSAVLHLGDYIYEYETGGYTNNIAGRTYEPTNEIISLTDYRVRYSHYKLDDDLRLLHQQYPFITIWDDHESANDSYKDGAENHTQGAEGNWVDRKAYSMQAYHEWMPIRTAPASGSIYRKIEYGDLINFYMLDTRLEGRDEQVGATSSDVNLPTRSLLGQTQYNWLTNELNNSTKQWDVLGQQVMIAPLEILGNPVNADQWDGYNYERNKLLNHVDSIGLENLVVLTGDIHTSWGNDIPGSGYDGSTGAGSVGVEYVVTSVTSPGSPIGAESLIMASNDHMQYVNLTEHGYMILDVNKQRTQGDWYYVDDVQSVSSNEFFGDGYFVADTTKHLQQASGFSVASNKYNKVYAPEMPLPAPNNIPEIDDQLVIFGAYPNPFTTSFTIQYYLFDNEEVNVRLVNAIGQVVFEDNIEQAAKGLNYMELNTETLQAGTYQLVLSTPNQAVSKTLVRLK